MDSKIDLSAVLSRFEENWSRRIDCSPGWHSLIVKLDEELSQIDPDYTIQQVKEKFGGLRYYFNTKTDRFKEMDSVVRRYEQIAWETCEVTGEHGVLMVRNGWYRTISPDLAPPGFEVVDREKLLDGEASS
jgi:hypothetical protein